MLLAGWGIEFLASGLPEYLANANSRVATLGIDATALGFTLALSMLTSFLFGVIPALQLSKVDLNEALKEGARTSGTRNRLRPALVVAEIALAMVVLVGGGLTIKNFWRLANVDLGYEPEGVLTARIDPSSRSAGRIAPRITADVRFGAIVKNTKNRRARRKIEKTGSKQSFVFFDSSWFVAIYSLPLR